MLNLCAIHCDYPRPKRARIFGRVILPPKPARATNNISLAHSVRCNVVDLTDYERVKQSSDPTFLLQNSVIDSICDEEPALYTDAAPPTATMSSLDGVIKSLLGSFSQKQEILFFIPITDEPTLSATWAMSVLDDIPPSKRQDINSFSTANWNLFSAESNLAEISRTSSTSTFAERDEDGLIERECLERTWNELQALSAPTPCYLLSGDGPSDITLKLSWTTLRPVHAIRSMLEITKHSQPERCATLDVSHIAFAELNQYEDHDDDEEMQPIEANEAYDLLTITEQQVHMLNGDEHKSICLYSFRAELEEDLSDFRASTVNKAVNMLSRPWLSYVKSLSKEEPAAIQNIKLAFFADEGAYGGSNSIFTASTLPNHIPIKASPVPVNKTEQSHLALIVDLRNASDIRSEFNICVSHWNDTKDLTVAYDDDWEATMFDDTLDQSSLKWEKPFCEIVEDAFCPGIPVISFPPSPNEVEIVTEQAASLDLPVTEMELVQQDETALYALSSPAKEASLTRECNESQVQEKQFAVAPSTSVAVTEPVTSVAVKRSNPVPTHTANKRVKLDSLLLGLDSVDTYLILRDNQQHQQYQDTVAAMSVVSSTGVTSAFLTTQPKPVPFLPTASLASMLDNSKVTAAPSPPPPTRSKNTISAARMKGLQIFVADDLYEARTNLMSALRDQYEIICKDFALCDGVMFVISECTGIVFLDIDTWLKPEQRRNWLLNMSQIALRYGTIWVLLKVSEAQVNEANYSSLLAQVHMSMFKFPCRVIIRDCLAHDINMEAELITMICQADVKASQERDDRSLTTYKRRAFFNLLDREYIAATCDFLQHFPTINLFMALLLVLTHENMSEIASSTSAQVQERLHKVSPNGDLLTEKVYRFMQVLHAQLN